MKFSDIPGHEAVKRRLTRMVSENRVPHALLLYGPQGIGKFAMARALAQMIHCEHPIDGDSCGQCQSCRQVESFNHPDTLYVFPVVKLEKHRTPPVSDDYAHEFQQMAKQRIFMDPEKWALSFDKKNAQPMIYVTESALLEQRLAITPTNSQYKVVVIWQPEKMNELAANKILKLIEEPLGKTVFILASDNAQAILPTIHSRCQPVEMLRLSDAIISDVLQRNRGLSKEDALAMAHLSEGSATQALKESDASDNMRIFHDTFVSLMRQAYSRNVAALRNWASDVAAMGREQEIRFYRFCERMIRENFFNNFHNPSLIYLNSQEAQFASRFSRFINEVNAPKMIEVFQNAITDIQGNANGKIVNFDLAVQMIILLRMNP